MVIYFIVTNDLSYDQRMIRICTSLANSGYTIKLVGRKLNNSIPLIKQPFGQKRISCLFNKGKLFYIEYNIRVFIYLLFKKMDCICAIDLDTILPSYFISKIKKISRVYDAHELFCEMKENPINFGTLNMHWCYVHHQGATVGFKFSLNGKIIVYITDNEFLRGYFGAPDVDRVPPEILVQYNDLIQFISNADVMVSESQYTNEEYVNKIGWGHTSLSNGCLLCKLGKVKRWIVTHHDPMHTDEFLDNKLFLTRQILESIGYPIPVSDAVDGMTEYF